MDWAPYETQYHLASRRCTPARAARRAGDQRPFRSAGRRGRGFTGRVCATMQRVPRHHTNRRPPLSGKQPTTPDHPQGASRRRARGPLRGRARAAAQERRSGGGGGVLVHQHPEHDDRGHRGRRADRRDRRPSASCGGKVSGKLNDPGSPTRRRSSTATRWARRTRRSRWRSTATSSARSAPRTPSTSSPRSSTSTSSRAAADRPPRHRPARPRRRRVEDDRPSAAIAPCSRASTGTTPLDLRQPGRRERRVASVATA